MVFVSINETVSLNRKGENIMRINTSRLWVSVLYLMGLYYAAIVPLHITVHLFDINDNSIRSSSGIGESYPILTLAWIVAHIFIGGGAYGIYNYIKWLFTSK